MIIDGNAAGPLIEQFKIARDAEAAATTALYEAMKSGIKDHGTLMALTDRMTATHNKKMDIWDELQAVALGN